MFRKGAWSHNKFRTESSAIVRKRISYGKQSNAVVDHACVRFKWKKKRRKMKNFRWKVRRKMKTLGGRKRKKEKYR